MRVYLRDPRSHINLALLQQYGSNAWRIHNYLNEATAQNIEKALEELKNLTTEVNRDRKNYQVRVLMNRCGCTTYRCLSADASRDAADLAGDAVDRTYLQYSADRDGECGARGRD